MALFMDVHTISGGVDRLTSRRHTRPTWSPRASTPASIICATGSTPRPGRSSAWSTPRTRRRRTPCTGRPTAWWPTRSTRSASTLDLGCANVSPMAPVVQLLGRPAIHGIPGGYQMRSRKSWALLAYLLLNERPPTRTQLADLLFEQADDPWGHCAGAWPRFAAGWPDMSESLGIRCCSGWRRAPARCRGGDPPLLGGGHRACRTSGTAARGVLRTRGGGVRVLAAVRTTPGASSHRRDPARGCPRVAVPRGFGPGDRLRRTPAGPDPAGGEPPRPPHPSLPDGRRRRRGRAPAGHLHRTPAPGARCAAGRGGSGGSAGGPDRTSGSGRPARGRGPRSSWAGPRSPPGPSRPGRTPFVRRCASPTAREIRSSGCRAAWCSPRH